MTPTDRMTIGISSPVVVAMPGSFSDWERSAGIEELASIVETADRLGFDHVTCSEHVVVPVDVAEQRGGTYWDPAVTLAYLAARTTRVRLLTQVLVLGYHHPLEIAKRYGTLDRVSGGRLVLGFGVGSLREEFELLGATFDGRGAIADEALAALRVSMSTSRPVFHGEHFDYSDVVLEPHAVQDHVPFWIGGRTPRSLKRAVALGDGWVPFGLEFDQLRQMTERTQLPQGFDVVLSSQGALDPLGDRAAAARKLEDVRSAGATIVNARVQAHSLSHYNEQLEALAALEKDRA